MFCKFLLKIQTISADHGLSSGIQPVKFVGNVLQEDDFEAKTQFYLRKFPENLHLNCTGGHCMGIKWLVLTPGTAESFSHYGWLKLF